MRKLVDEQAIIDVVYERIRQIGYEHNTSVLSIIQAIQDLLSVQQEIIECKDCKYGSPDGRYGCRVYHYKKYETHDMKSYDFCSYAGRRQDG